MNTQRLIFSIDLDEKGNIIESADNISGELKDWQIDGKPSKLLSNENPKSLHRIFLTKLLKRTPFLGVLSIKKNNESSVWSIVASVHESGKSQIKIFPINLQSLEIKNLYQEIKSVETEDNLLTEEQIDNLAITKKLKSLYTLTLEIINTELENNNNTSLNNNQKKVTQYEASRSILKDCFSSMFRLIAKQDDLIIGAAKITSLSETFNIISLNTSVKSLRLQTRTIGTVAVHLQESSQKVIQNVKGLQTSVNFLLNQLKELTLSTTVAILSIDAIVNKLSSDETPSTSSINALKVCLKNAIIEADKLKKSLRDADPYVDSIQKNLLSLQHIQNIGLMESAVTNENDTFDVTFLDIRGCLDKVETEFTLVKENVTEMTTVTNDLSSRLHQASF